MKRRYHSDFILQYQLGLLPQEIVDQIPPATRHYWKHHKDNKHFAPEVLYTQEENLQMIKAFLNQKKLYEVAKAFYHVVLALQEITDLKTQQQQLQRNKKQVVKIIEKHKTILGLARVLKIFGISQHQFYAWRSEQSCERSVFQKCYRSFPNQLTAKEVATIRTYLTDIKYRGWSTISVYYQMLRDGAASMSAATFYRYARKLNLSKPKIKKPKYPKGIQSNTPGTLLHMDVTIYKLPDHTKAYLYVLMDNRSRYILNCRVSRYYSPTENIQNLQEGLSKYNLPYKTILCDGGIENLGSVDQKLQEFQIEKLIAQKDIRFSNSMVEAVNKRIKYDFLYWQDFPDFAALERYLPKLVQQYNAKPHSALFGFTPSEVFEGVIPSRKNFKLLIPEASVKRSLDNLSSTCISCSV